MTPRRAPGEVDYDPAFDDPDDGWFGSVESADAPPSPTDEPGAHRATTHDVIVEDPVPDPEHGGAVDAGRWHDEAVEAVPLRYVNQPRRPAEPAATTGFDPFAPWRETVSSGAAWEFKAARSDPWYRAKPAIVGIIAIAAAVLVAAVVVLALRNTGPADETSTAVTPEESTASPAPSSSAPALSITSQVPLPPPVPPLPPPPPPLTAQEMNPPVATREYTPPRRRDASDDSDEAQTDDKPTPITRTPLRATPPLAPPKSGRDSSTPGDAPGRRRFGFGF